MLGHVGGGSAPQLRLSDAATFALDVDLQGTVGQLTDQWTAGTLAFTGTQGLTFDNQGPFGPLFALSEQQHLDSTSVTVGDSGKLTLGHGAELTTSLLVVNSAIGNTAEFRLDAAYNGDSGAQVSASSTFVGQLGGLDGTGDNELTIHSGAFHTQSLVVGVNAGSSGRVTVGIVDPAAGQAVLRVTSTSPAFFGIAGRGELTVLENGVADIQTSLLLGASGGSGSISVQGADSMSRTTCS